MFLSKQCSLFPPPPWFTQTTTYIHSLKTRNRPEASRAYKKDWKSAPPLLFLGSSRKNRQFTYLLLLLRFSSTPSTSKQVSLQLTAPTATLTATDNVHRGRHELEPLRAHHADHRPVFLLPQLQDSRPRLPGVLVPASACAGLLPGLCREEEMELALWVGVEKAFLQMVGWDGMR